MQRLARLLAIALAALALLPATAAVAAGRVAWQQRIREATAAVEQAEARSANADDAYDEMRHRKYPRGEARAAIEAERTAARAAVVEAKKELERPLAEARREGVPPGWVRVAQDDDAMGNAPPADVPEGGAQAVGLDTADDVEPARRADLPFATPSDDD